MADMTPFYSTSLHTLLGRDCVECDTSTPLKCPDCPSGTVCIQTSLTCSECPYRKCVPQAQSGATQSGSSPSSSSGPNIGAIVGGIIGGLVVVGVAVWLVWHFFLKPRRDAWERDYIDGTGPFEKTESDYARSVGAGTSGTRASVASTAFTRASNVIQIAFIPGVTGRADGSGYTPPVPPIPSFPSPQAGSPYSDGGNNGGGGGGDHYFMPEDLRGSMYSGFTDDGASFHDRRSVGRSIAPSIAPSLLRQSVASTIFTQDAIQHPMPAQHIVRVRANMVNVQGPGSGGGGGSASGSVKSASPSAPAVPTLDRTRFPVNPSRAAEAGGADTAAPPATPTQASTLHVPGSGILLTADDASDFSIATFRDDDRATASIEEAKHVVSSQHSRSNLRVVESNTAGPFSDANRLPDSDSDATP